MKVKQHYKWIKKLIRKAEDGVKTGKLSEEYPKLAKSTICTIISQKCKTIEDFEDNKR